MRDYIQKFTLSGAGFAAPASGKRNAPQFGRGWSGLWISPDSALSEELKQFFANHGAGLPLTSRSQYPARQELAATFAGVAVCLLDVSSQPDAALRLAADLPGMAPGTTIVAILKESNPDLIVRFLRQGVQDFLVRPFAPEQLRGALEKLAGRHAAQAGPSAKVYCVMPASGAAGASTLACHLAQSWKRLGKERVLLADLDPLTGTLCFLLKLQPMHSFVEVLLRSQSIDDDLWKAMIRQTRGLDVILAPEALGDGLERLTDPSPLVNFARSRYDVIVLDAGGPHGPWNLALANLCDELLLVASNELTAVHGVQHALRRFDAEHIDRSKIRLVVNRHQPGLGVKPESIGAALGLEVYDVIPDDREAVGMALIDGKLVAPTSRAGKSLHALAEKLMGKTESPSQFSGPPPPLPTPKAPPAPPPAPPAQRATRRGGFTSLFS